MRRAQKPDPFARALELGPGEYVIPAGRPQRAVTPLEPRFQLRKANHTRPWRQSSTSTTSQTTGSAASPTRQVSSRSLRPGKKSKARGNAGSRPASSAGVVGRPGSSSWASFTGDQRTLETADVGGHLPTLEEQILAGPFCERQDAGTEILRRPWTQIDELRVHKKLHLRSKLTKRGFALGLDGVIDPVVSRIARPEWSDRHHVVDSMGNDAVPEKAPVARVYFPPPEAGEPLLQQALLRSASSTSARRPSSKKRARKKGPRFEGKIASWWEGAFQGPPPSQAAAQEDMLRETEDRALICAVASKEAISKAVGSPSANCLFPGSEGSQRPPWNCANWHDANYYRHASQRVYFSS